MNNFIYGKNGVSLTKGFERCILRAYDDQRPDYILELGDQILGTLTIGWGHTGPDVYIGLTWTQDQADARLAIDYASAQRFANQRITLPISQDENDAIVDWVFNVGQAAAAASTLLRDLNAGDIEGAAAQFDAWDHVSGQVVAGLLRRRQAETALFEQGETEETT